MKTKDILVIAAIAAVGWYFYRTSKGLPLLPSGILTSPTTVTPVATTPPNNNPIAPGTVGGTIITDLPTILNGLGGLPGELGISGSSTPDTTNAGIDDLSNTV